MRRAWTLIAVASFVWVVTWARADFRTLTAPGTPYDVEIKDAGWAAVVASDGGFELLDPDGGTLSWGRSIGTSSGNLVSAFIDSSDCLTGVSNNNQEFSSCRAPLQLSASPSFTRVRHSQSGASYATGTSSTNADLSFAPVPPPGSGTVWTDLPESITYIPSLVTPAVSAFRLGSVEYGLFGFIGSVHLSTGSGSPPADVPTRISNVGDLQLFQANGQLRALVAGNGGLDLWSFDGGTAAVSELADFDSSTGVAFTTGTGDGVFGDGCGMAIVQDAGVPGLLYRAVPDPSAPALRWVPSTVVPSGLAGTLQRVSCDGTEFCVLLSQASGNVGPNVAVYRNRQPPWVALPNGAPLAQVNEGASTNASVDAGDNDGDAVFLTWDSPPPGTPLTVSPLSSSPERKAIAITASAGSALLCNHAFVDFPLTVHVSDGLAGHEDAGTYSIRVVHTNPAAAPSAAPQQMHVHAGGGQAVFSAAPPGSGCQPIDYSWTLQSGAGFTWGAQGSTLTISPNATLCASSPAAVTFQVQGIEDGGLASNPGTLTFFVDPWGLPNTPYANGAVTSQTAGTTVVYTADAGHACSAFPSFPGVDTVWSLDPGSLSGVSMVPSGAAASVAAPDCINGPVHLTASNTTRGDDAGIASTATQTIQIQTVLSSLSSTQLVLDGGYQTGLVVGTANELGANCPSLRQLHTSLQLLAPDGGVLGQTSAAVPGAWSIPFDAPCVSQGFQVVGQLLDGADAGPTARLLFSTPDVPAGIGNLNPSTIGIRCGENARGTVAMTVESGQCPSAAYLWQQQSGPPAQVSTVDAHHFEIATQGADFSALLGQHLVFSISADGGVGNAATGVRDVEIVTDPFVRLEHTAHPPVVSDSSVVDFQVQLKNPSACVLTPLEHRETLTGFSYVPGSARLDGAPIAAQLQGDQLVISGITLAGNGSAMLSFQARPRLFSKLQPSGSVFLNGVAVSSSQGFAPIQSRACACGHAQGPPVFGVLGLWVLALGTRPRKGRARGLKVQK